jgi:hypothetical protein
MWVGCPSRGGVTGAPGRNAALTVLEDLGLIKRSRVLNLLDLLTMAIKLLRT